MSVFPNFDPERHVISEHKATMCLSAQHFRVRRRGGIRPRGWYLISRRAWIHARQLSMWMRLIESGELVEAMNRQLGFVADGAASSGAS